MAQQSEMQQHRLYSAIYRIIKEKGLKSATMDTVAHELGMSKRTLYEIFDNKHDMVIRTLEYHSQLKKANFDRLIAESPDTFSAVLEIIRMNREEIQQVNVNFFRDMDRLYPHFREDYDKHREKHLAAMMHIFRKCVDEGDFRPDVNILILSRMLELQMESLKRMESLFPPEITLVEIYDTVARSFLAGVVTEQGAAKLKKYFSGK